jgi:hypothetical protein
MRHHEFAAPAWLDTDDDDLRYERERAASSDADCTECPGRTGAHVAGCPNDDGEGEVEEVADDE